MAASRCLLPAAVLLLLALSSSVLGSRDLTQATATATSSASAIASGNSTAIAQGIATAAASGQNTNAAAAALANAISAGNGSAVAQSLAQAYAQDPGSTAQVLGQALADASGAGNAQAVATTIVSAIAQGGGAAQAVSTALAQAVASGGCSAVANALGQAQAQATQAGNAAAFTQAIAQAGVDSCLTCKNLAYTLNNVPFSPTAALTIGPATAASCVALADSGSTLSGSLISFGTPQPARPFLVNAATNSATWILALYANGLIKMVELQVTLNGGNAVVVADKAAFKFTSPTSTAALTQAIVVDAFKTKTGDAPQGTSGYYVSKLVLTA